MEKKEFFELLDANPVIAAAKDDGGLAAALESNCRVVFTLYGNIMDIADITRRIKAAGKAVLVHMDLVDGLGQRDIAVDYIAENTAADGILTTKTGLVKRAEVCGLLAIQRFFLLDSKSIANIYRQHPGDSACAIEVLPGLMHKIIRQLAKASSLPIIAGGLISEKDDVVAALSAGARAVSTTNPGIWKM